MPPATPTQRPDPAAEPAQRTQYYRELLHDLLDLGVQLARAVQTEVDEQRETATAAAPAFDRIARAVRRTILLAQRLDDPPRPAANRAAARRRIIREVEDAIDQRARTDAEAGRLNAELQERLDAPELEDEVDNRPAPEIIADICRDLGIADIAGLHLWKRRTPSDIAALCARAAQPPTARRTSPPNNPFHLVPAPDDS